MKRIQAGELRQMEDQEGLIFQGCGGELQEWLDGVNGLLTEEGILLNGSRFETAFVFENEGLTNLLFPFEGVELAMGKLAIWRLRTHDQFGGTWLSDYVPNRLGGFLHKQEVSKPDCRLIGENSNIFNLIGIASRALHQCGLHAQAEEMRQRIMGGECHNYSAALNVIGEYVNITGPEETDMTMGGM